MLTQDKNILSAKSTPVDLEEGKRIAELLREEIRGLKWGTCVGLAAPQIGINKRVFIALDIAYINPEIIFYGPQKKVYNEGCYSLKQGESFHITRSYVIKMRWMNIKGQTKEASFNALPAEVLQHEHDHLEGILCNHEQK